jgi:hypothetical protein
MKEGRMNDMDVQPIAPIERPENLVVAGENGGYEAVRFNAMKHGVLSRLTVLAHENHAEFDDLLAALLNEHKPTAMTERHLVEELAAIIWRKRRVLLAEGAAINRGLRSVTHTQSDSPIPASAPFESELSKDGADLPDLLNASADDITERLRFAELDLAATRKAAAILQKGGARAYSRALRELLTESHECWDAQVRDEEYEPNAEGLADFIEAILEPVCVRAELEMRFASAIKRQTIGEGLQANRLLSLNRYETHLDRKFERTLAMILKLKDLRRA